MMVFSAYCMTPSHLFYFYFVFLLKPAVPALSVLLTPMIEVLTCAGYHKELKPILSLKQLLKVQKNAPHISSFEI